LPKKFYFQYWQNGKEKGFKITSNIRLGYKFLPIVHSVCYCIKFILCLQGAVCLKLNFLKIDGKTIIYVWIIIYVILYGWMDKARQGFIFLLGTNPLAYYSKFKIIQDKFL
jgi:hypothetical protein